MEAQDEGWVKPSRNGQHLHVPTTHVTNQQTMNVLGQRASKPTTNEQISGKTHIQDEERTEQPTDKT